MKIMEIAIAEAHKALQCGEIPVGCVIARDNEIIAQTHNMCESENCCTCHAEMNAINTATRITGRKTLEDCDMYVTLEPCPMCAGAIINARIKRLFIGANEPKSGCFGSVSDFNKLPFNHKVETYYGINEDECSLLMKDFFRTKR